MKTIRIGTRKSILALWQAEKVASILKSQGFNTEIVKIMSEGDSLKGPLYKSGGKGLFCSALEQYLLDKKIDIAVHSVKDMSVNLDDRLPLKFILKRDSPQDCLVSFKGNLSDLPFGAQVGTTSLRRRAQLMNFRNDIKFVDLRGNLDTRLKKLKDGIIDAIVVSAAGLKRLGLYDNSYCFDLDIISAAGQGAIGVQTRKDEFDEIEFLNDLGSFVCCDAERLFVKNLNASCNFPIGAYAFYQKQWCIKTMYANEQTFECIKCFECGGSLKEVLEKCIAYTKSKIK